jgi:hypothetical protein
MIAPAAGVKIWLVAGAMIGIVTSMVWRLGSRSSSTANATTMT